MSPAAERRASDRVEELAFLPGKEPSTITVAFTPFSRSRFRIEFSEPLAVRQVSVGTMIVAVGDQSSDLVERAEKLCIHVLAGVVRSYAPLVFAERGEEVRAVASRPKGPAPSAKIVWI